jgi:hypothetical protein
MTAYSVLLHEKFKDDSLVGIAHPTAALVCLFGILLRIVLSDAVLPLLGLSYGSMGGGLLSKIHPGNYFIFMSFFVLLLARAQPLRQWIQIYREHPAFARMFLVLLMIFVYWVIRGPKGVGLLFDTHLPVPLSAIVLSYAPRSYCRRAATAFLAFAALNSIIGIAEALGKFRIMPSDPEWVVLKEEHFRASALSGHPLNNASLTAMALLAVLASTIRPWLKGMTAFLFTVSLVGFGGRTAFAFSILCLCFYSLAALRDSVKDLTMMKLFGLLLVTVIAPLVLFGGLYLALQSGMGERLVANSQLDDPSAAARTMAFDAFNYVGAEDLIFGLSSDRVDYIVGRMGLTLPMSDIENPWILMILQLGLVFFTLWLLALLAFVYELMRNKPFILKLAILGYFLLASAFNSFGRKDFLFTLMCAVVICISRGSDKNAADSNVALEKM